MVLKSLKSDPPGTFCLIILQPVSLSKICMTLFDQMARDGKSVLTFQMLAHIQHLWPLGQKSVTQIFDRWYGYKIMKQNVSDF